MVLHFPIVNSQQPILVPCFPGAGHPTASRNAVVIGVVMGLTLTLIIILPIWMAPRTVASVFTIDDKVSDIMSNEVPL